MRRTEYITFHRALYFLAPRPVWWQSPAPPDGTWESRWWISAPLDAASVEAAARLKGATCVLVHDIRPNPRLGRVVADWNSGYLLQLDDSRPCLAVVAKSPLGSSDGWPLRLLAALLVIAAIGDLLLGRHAIAPGQWNGRRCRGQWEPAGRPSRCSLLDASGVGLDGQRVVLTMIAALWVVIRLFQARRSAGQNAPSTKTDRGRVERTSRWPAVATVSSLLSVAHIACVAVVAIGRPLQAWDSWVNWGSKARVMWIEGGLTPAVYADASRAVTLPDYPLFLPLLETWIYRWLGRPDDRLAGIVSVFFYIALIALCYTAVRRWGGSRPIAAAASAVVATMTNVVLLAAVVFADIPLAAMAVVAAVLLARWLR